MPEHKNICIRSSKLKVQICNISKKVVTHHGSVIHGNEWGLTELESTHIPKNTARLVPLSQDKPQKQLWGNLDLLSSLVGASPHCSVNSDETWEGDWDLAYTIIANRAPSWLNPPSSLSSSLPVQGIHESTEKPSNKS